MSPLNSGNKNESKAAYWRSLDELADAPEFRQELEREFHEGASEAPDDVSRRQFITVMGASVALASFTGCRRPVEHIVPYVRQPEEVVPGRALNYASTMPLGEDAFGVLVRSNEGRPTKIEGNENHPSTRAYDLPGQNKRPEARGAANSLMLASVLDLYDPARDPLVQRDEKDQAPQQPHGEEWSKLAELIAGADLGTGAGLAVLSEGFSSPTIERMAKRFAARFPEARWITYDAISNENIYKGTEAVFGRPLRPVYSFDRASTVLALDYDLVLGESNNVRHAADFAKGRHVKDKHEDEKSVSRLYAVESMYTLTGGIADHRLRVQSSQIGAFTATIANRLGIKADGGGEFDRRFVDSVIADLQAAAAQNRALVVAGRRQPAAVHALVAAINEKLTTADSTVSAPRTVQYVAVEDTRTSSTEDLATLVADMASGEIKSLIVIGGDPVYNAPGDLNFGDALQHVPFSICLADRLNETSAHVNHFLLRSHYLESWGDARAYDGTLSLIQPLIEPLYKSRTTAEFLNIVSTGKDVSGYDLVRQTWNGLIGAIDEGAWRRIVHDGVHAGSAYKPVPANLVTRQLETFLADNPMPSPATGMELTVTVSNTIYDGRYANNGWLQELPDPVTKVTWDNVAAISPATAHKLGVKRKGQKVRVTAGQRNIELPALVLPGHADDAVTVELGYGQDIGRVSQQSGRNAYALRSSQSDTINNVSVTLVQGTHLLATTQDHQSMEGRPLLRENTLMGYKKSAKNHELLPAAHEMDEDLQLYASHNYANGYQWGMAIDLNLCNGCNACAIACQSENNIPVVGKVQTEKGREMAWIRIDRYFKGDTDDPQMTHQPVPCQHCENAPCEQVCPVSATVHDEQGLNVMVYNRCIGTRYCANNCPYKVRRFNFFNFTKGKPEVHKMSQNPEVTVRSRGVKEKCSFCIQRINHAKIDAKLDDRQVRDGEVMTACQQACPVGAIVFGDINSDEEWNPTGTRVMHVKGSDRNYKMLQELNTRPRTTYLGKIRNPSASLAPAIAASDDHGHEGH